MPYLPMDIRVLPLNVARSGNSPLINVAPSNSPFPNGQSCVLSSFECCPQQQPCLPLDISMSFPLCSLIKKIPVLSWAFMASCFMACEHRNLLCPLP
jgi:hypothetical protein